MNRSTTLLIAVSATFAVLLRVVPLPFWNFSALGALALLCGAVVRPIWLALIIPVACRAATDVILEMRTGYGFYGSWMFDYSAYLLIVALGGLIQPRGWKAPFVGIGSALVFFLLSNFGVWLMSHGGPQAYPRTLSGLLECYVLGLPFIRGTLVGDVIWSWAFFAALHLIEVRVRAAQSGVIRSANTGAEGT